MRFYSKTLHVACLLSLIGAGASNASHLPVRLDLYNESFRLDLRAGTPNDIIHDPVQDILYFDVGAQVHGENVLIMDHPFNVRRGVTLGNVRRFVVTPQYIVYLLDGYQNYRVYVRRTSLSVEAENAPGLSPDIFDFLMGPVIRTAIEPIAVRLNEYNPLNSITELTDSAEIFFREALREFDYNAVE